MTVKRDWTDAIEKRDSEGRCRYCSVTGIKIDAAHITKRSLDRTKNGTEERYVHPDSIVPLCASVPGRKGCHEMYDAHEISISAVLTRDEVCMAIQQLGTLEAARRRIDPLDYRPEIEAARRAALAQVPELSE